MSFTRRLAETVKQHAQAAGYSSRMDLRVILILWGAGIFIGFLYMICDWRVFAAGMLTLAALAVVFTKAEYGFYLMLLILPVGLTEFTYYLRGTRYMPAVFLYMFAIPLTAGALFVRGTIEKASPYLFKTPIAGIVLLGAVYLCTTLLWAPNKPLALTMGVFLLLHVSLFFLIIHFIRDADSMRRTLNVLMIVGVIASTGVILSQWEEYENKFYMGSGILFKIFFGEKSDRPCGFGGPTDMAGFLSMMAFLAAGRFIASERIRYKLLHGVLASYMTIGMILTACRGALVGMTLGIVFLMFAHPFASNKVIKYSAITFILLFATILIAKPSYLDRILVGFGYSGTLYFSSDVGHGSTYSSGSEVSGMDNRKKWWKAAFAAMREKPLTLIFGLGLGGFIFHTGANHTHSVPLSFFFDMGLVGVVILITGGIILARQFIFYMMRAKHTYSYYMFLAAVAVFVSELCLHGLIDYDFYSHSAKMFWFPLGYVMAALNIVRNENSELKSEAT
jgi:hypothetical protein